MRRAATITLRFVGGAYLIALFCMFMWGYFVVASEQGGWAALNSFWEEWSPFAVLDWLIRLVLAAPGIGLVVLANKLEQSPGAHDG